MLRHLHIKRGTLELSAQDPSKLKERGYCSPDLPALTCEPRMRATHQATNNNPLEHAF